MKTSISTIQFFIIMTSGKLLNRPLSPPSSPNLYSILRLCGIVILGFQPANLYMVYHLAQGVAVGLEYVGLSTRILYALWRNCATWQIRFARKAFTYIHFSLMKRYKIGEAAARQGEIQDGARCFLLTYKPSRVKVGVLPVRAFISIENKRFFICCFAR
jgi:hypothetical protein